MEIHATILMGQSPTVKKISSLDIFRNKKRKRSAKEAQKKRKRSAKEAQKKRKICFLREMQEIFCKLPQ
ncbi:MAG: hypothetical protein R3Y56_08615 [Akkermansia sp.]